MNVVERDIQRAEFATEKKGHGHILEAIVDEHQFLQADEQPHGIWQHADSIAFGRQHLQSAQLSNFPAKVQCVCVCVCLCVCVCVCVCLSLSLILFFLPCV